MPETGSEQFGEVEVQWTCDRDCRVRMLFRRQLFLDCVLTQAAPIVPFSLEDEGGSVLVRGQVSRDGRGAGWLTMTYPGGAVKRHPLWGPPTPVPPGPPSPEPEEEAAEVVSGEADLFPFIYLRPWPKAPAADLLNRFVPYVGEPASGSFYSNLAALKAAGKRSAMEQEAVNFIEGEPPYEGQFLRTLHHLSGLIRRFSECNALLRAQPPLSFAEFQCEVERILGTTWEELLRYLTADEGYQTEMERCWQNFFALAVVLGYDRQLLDGLVRTLVMSRLLDRMAVPLAPGEAGDEESGRWRPERIREGLWATVILPEAVFPMPPSELIPKRGLEPLPPIQPYAIGDLEIVRRKLRRYAPGEVCRIENVMKGERIETTRRQRNQTRETLTEKELESAAAATELAGERADLTGDLQRELFEEFKIEYQTKYGPPVQGDATGFYYTHPVQAGDPAGKTVESASQFARRITARTASRFERKIARLREMRTEREQEETVVTHFDASQSAANVRGIYRWVNKVYRAWVENYGYRLILEFSVPKPAQHYISGEQSLEGRSLLEPRAPSDFGLTDFTCVSTDPASPCYYPKLAAEYGAIGVEPPPPDRTTSATFQPCAGVHTVEIPVPDGYCAQKAYLTASWRSAAGECELSGMIGRQLVHAPSSASGDYSHEYPMDQETGAVPAAVALVAGAETATPATYLASVEILSKAGAARFEQWQIETYRATLDAYQRRLAAYYNAAGVQPAAAASRNPLASREAMAGALKSGVMRLLMAHAASLVKEPEQEVLGAPRTLQFLDQAFEWKEMAFAFTVLTGEAPEERQINYYMGVESLFTAFLQAASARVLLPVSPGFDFLIPYFLAAGAIWAGSPELTPAHTQSVDLIDELKSVRQADSEERKPRSKPWNVVTPTSMVVLQEGQDLPSFE